MKRHSIHVAVFTAVVAVLGATVWAAVGSPTQTKTKSAVKERVTEPLRAEHRELVPHIDALRDAGDAVGVAPLEEQQKEVHDSYAFLTTQLIPHAVAEDEVLYAEVDRLIGTNGTTRATDTMRRDHTEVGTLTEELGTLGEQLHGGTLSEAQEQDLRRVLYSLHGIVKLHFAKEEEVYLPLLDRELTAEEAQHMFEEMEQVAAKTGGAEHAH